MRARIDASGAVRERHPLTFRPRCLARNHDRTLFAGGGPPRLEDQVLESDELSALAISSCAPDDQGFLLTVRSLGGLLGRRMDLNGELIGDPLTIASGDAAFPVVGAAHSGTSHLFTLLGPSPDYLRPVYWLPAGTTTARPVGRLETPRAAHATRDGGFALIGEDPDRSGRPTVRWVSTEGTMSAAERLVPGRGRVQLHGHTASNQGIIVLMSRDDGTTPEFDTENVALVIAAVEAPYAEIPLDPLDVGRVVGLHQQGDAVRVVYQRTGDGLLSTRLLPLPQRSPE